LDDSQLVNEAAKGNQDAFTELVNRYRLAIYKIAYKIVLHEDDALDVTQHVLMKLAKSIHAYQEQGNFQQWLSVMATRTAFDYLRKHKRRIQTVQVDDIGQIRANNNSPIQSLDEKRIHERVEWAAAKLSEQQRAIVLLRLKEDLGAKEIAEQLELSPEQVRIQLHRAIHKIRELLNEKHSS